MSSLVGKTCVVIGGAGLLGSAFSRACASAGGTVIIADSDADKGAALAGELSVPFEHVDVTDPVSVQALAERIASKYPSIDGVLNAAYPKTAKFGRSFENADVADMLADLDLHVGACLSIAKAFTPLMKKQKSGSIVFMGSIYGIAAPRFEIYDGTSMTLPAEYAAAKAAIIALARYFATLFGKDGVRFNAISPGGIADKQPETFIERYSEHLALGHGLLSPEDVAGSAVFLLSDASRHITGQNVVVDGGWTL